MKNIVLFIAFTWLFAGTTGCLRRALPPDEPGSVLQDSSEGRQAECLPDFPDHNGWYGADAAYSIALPIEKGRVSLWLFGDSFVQRPGRPEGRAYPFVHNSIGLSSCRSGGEWQLETFWRRNPEAEPRAFFVPAPDAAWVRDAQRVSSATPYYWPFDGFIAHDNLFVSLLRVVESPPRGPFNLPFRLVGTDLARIENYRDAPEDWRIQISTLSNNTLAFPGSAFVEGAMHIYAFAFFDRDDGRSPRMLSRLERKALIDWRPDLSDAVETWAEDARWIEGFEPAEAMILMNDDASEMSVQFDPKSKRFFAIYADPARDRRAGGPGFVRVRSAESLTGPWSDPRPLLPIPETVSDRDEPTVSEGNVEGLFCYAGKAHPQFGSPSEIVITYVCNLFADDAHGALRALERLEESPEIYRPRAVSIERRMLGD